uniref:Uncharacterized protein n=1 Tax=Rhizophora mucronata TaxID=61149 RepID=A0A2P2P822_RHIMU
MLSQVLVTGRLVVLTMAITSLISGFT